jgi:hypothetical protein
MNGLMTSVNNFTVTVVNALSQVIDQVLEAATEQMSIASSLVCITISACDVSADTMDK